MNELFGKTIVFDGDSICRADSESKVDMNVGWPYRIGRAGKMKWYNYAVGGGTVTAGMYTNAGDARHWVSRYIDNIHENHESLDYLILEGGTNDADLLGIGSERFGEYDPTDYSGSYDDTTFTGALESLFYKAITYYPTAKIGYIVAQKMSRSDCGYGKKNRRRYYFLRAIEICKKWGIPYLDLWDGAPINPSLDVYYDPSLDKEANIKSGKAYTDGQHLTSVGYDIVSPKIFAWIKTL